MPLNASQLIAAVGGPKFEIPKNGWHAHTFAIYGVQLLTVLVRLSKITRMRAASTVAQRANEIFKAQLERVIEKVVAQTRSKATMREIMLPGDEQVWARAIQEVFAHAGLEVVTELVPPIQSTMAQGYSKTAILLGQQTDPLKSPGFARDAREIGQKITRINDTTRKLFQEHIHKAVLEKKTIAETVKDLRNTLPEINARRQLTIARTELNNAWTHGSANSFKENKTITTVSIIGCEAREPSSPHYHGQSTCNYEDLPVAELDAFLEVGFHVNHTGTLVPSGFRRADGSNP